jgi:hypothetical protein
LWQLVRPQVFLVQVQLSLFPQQQLLLLLHFDLRSFYLLQLFLRLA